VPSGFFATFRSRKNAANSDSGRPSSVSTCALTYHHSVVDEA